MARKTSPKPSDARGIGSADPSAQSLDLQVHSDRLLAAASNTARLERAYADYIQAALDAPLWSARHPDSVRIPWRLAKQAAVHPSLHDILGSPGLYLFGDEEGGDGMGTSIAEHGALDHGQGMRRCCDHLATIPREPSSLKTAVAGARWSRPPLPQLVNDAPGAGVDSLVRRWPLPSGSVPRPTGG